MISRVILIRRDLSFYKFTSLRPVPYVKTPYTHAHTQTHLFNEHVYTRVHTYTNTHMTNTNIHW